MTIDNKFQNDIMDIFEIDYIYDNKPINRTIAKPQVENKKENLTISKTKTKESVKQIVKNNVNLEKKDHASKKGLNKFSDKFKNNLNIKNSWRDNLTQEEKRYLSSHPGPYFESEYTLIALFFFFTFSRATITAKSSILLFVVSLKPLLISFLCSPLIITIP